MHIKLPDLLADWPFPEVSLNVHHEVICEESTKWTESFSPFDASTQAAFNRYNFGFLVAVSFPHADPLHFRITCDLMSFYFVWDDLSDKADGATARVLSEEIKDALSDPSKPRPPGESVLGEMAKSFWSRALMIASPSSARRFVKDFGAYTDAVAEEAADRDVRHIRTIDEYLDLRRRTVGVRSLYNFFLLSEDLPDEVISHPCIESLVLGAIDMSVLSNDVYSYDKEQACGDPHNMVTVVMHEKGLDVQAAMDYTGERNYRVAMQFLEDMKHVPTFSKDVDKLVQKYVACLANWVAAEIEWCFKTERYFGKKGKEIRSGLVIELRPRTLGI